MLVWLSMSFQSQLFCYVVMYKGSVTIVAGFSPEFDHPFLWRSKHQTKNVCLYQSFGPF